MLDYDVGICEEGGDVKRYTTNIDSYLRFMRNIEAILTAWMKIKKLERAFLTFRRLQ